MSNKMYQVLLQWESPAENSWALIIILLPSQRLRLKAKDTSYMSSITFLMKHLKETLSGSWLFFSLKWEVIQWTS